MARELNVVVKELESAMNDVQAKRDALTKAEASMHEAAKQHKEAQDKAAVLKQELDHMFSMFNSGEGRVRKSN